MNELLLNNYNKPLNWCGLLLELQISIRIMGLIDCFCGLFLLGTINAHTTTTITCLSLRKQPFPGCGGLEPTILSGHQPHPSTAAWKRLPFHSTTTDSSYKQPLQFNLMAFQEQSHTAIQQNPVHNNLIMYPVISVFSIAKIGKPTQYHILKDC